MSAAQVSSRAGGRQWFEAAAAVCRSGVLTPPGPRRALRMAEGLYRHGGTPATLFAVAAARYPDRAALIDDAGTITFGELYRQATALAVHLHARRPSSVAVACRNHRGFVLGFAAAAILGSEFIAINTEMPPPQLTELLRRHAPDVLVYDDEFAQTVDRSGIGAYRVCAGRGRGADGHRRMLEEICSSRSGGAAKPARRPGKITLLTSGTTGLAKGVPRSVRPWGIVQLAATGCARLDLRSQDTVWIGPPFFHGFGLLTLLGAVAVGATSVCRRRFDADTAVEDMARHRVDVLVAVPVMLRRLLDVDGIAEIAPRVRLRAAVTGAAPVTTTVIARFRRLFGPVLINGYGSTEAGIVSVATARDLDQVPSTLGRPALGVAIRVVDSRHRLVAPGERGRIFVRGPLGYSGYTSDSDGAVPPSKTVIDGFVDTGDVGYVDASGRLFLVGRSDDMIISGGENIFPGEVENALAEHPDVADAVVVGVPDPEFGQVLHAFVVGRGGATVDSDALKAHVVARLERYKAPKRFHALEQVPRNAGGKVLRQELIAMAESDHGPTGP